MKKLSLKIAALVLAVSPLAATATPTVVKATCINDATRSCTVGIDGLVIGGMTFNVDFVQGIYESIFAVNDPFFLGDEPGALDALEAIVSVLNVTADVDILGHIGTGTLLQYETIFTPYSTSFPCGYPSCFTAQVASRSGPGLLAVDGSTDDDAAYDFTYQTTHTGIYAFTLFEKVTTAAVPAPTTLSLLAIGLAGLGFRRRRAMTHQRA